MKKKKAEKIILFLVMVALALLYIVPFLMMGLGSFKNQADAAKFDLSLPTQWIFSNYKHVLESGKILSGYINSLIVTVPVTLVSVFLGAISGIVISRRNDKMSHGIYYYCIIGLTLSLQTASIFFLLQALHIYGTFFSVICIFISLRIPFTVMTFCSFVKGVPREIDEAAIDVWNNFMIPLFYLGSAKKATVSMAIYSFFGRYNRDWQYVFAALMLVVLPMLLLFIILQKHIIAGMTAGAVKG